MTEDKFINEYLSDLPPDRLSAAVADLTELTDTGLTVKHLDYLILLHNINVAGIHYTFVDPSIWDDIKFKLQTLKDKLQ